MINNRLEEIKKRNLTISTRSAEPEVPIDFGKIKLGLKTLDDAVVKLGDFRKINSQMGDKAYIQQAIDSQNEAEMRKISNFYFRISGIYSRLCRHASNLYRYDWVLTPHIERKISNDSIISLFRTSLRYLDNFRIKSFLGETALKVIKNGVYYGYIIRDKKFGAQVQELDPNYCRSRFSVRGKPAVEFNMKFFDDYYKSVDQRMKILSMMPAEFKKGYVAFKKGELPPEVPGESGGWYLLDINNTVKFNLGGADYPIFISVIPHLIDLDAAQDLDRKRMAQKLLKIIIQKMPLDKNGDLIFDVDEAQQLHNNVVQMLGKAIGLDVLTTFADVDVADLSDNSSVTSIDELEKVERTVYNESGTAQNLFNTDGNIALEKSILDDEANLYDLILQFQAFLNDLLSDFNTNPKKIYFTVDILPTTIYNYKDMAKLYKEQTSLGYSKWLPQIALGQSQSFILDTAKFENEILQLTNIFIPPMSSNTMSAASAGKGGDQETGRPEKADDEKSEKTIQNRESMN